MRSTKQGKKKAIDGIKEGDGGEREGMEGAGGAVLKIKQKVQSLFIFAEKGGPLSLSLFRQKES